MTPLPPIRGGLDCVTPHLLAAPLVIINERPQETCCLFYACHPGAGNCLDEHVMRSYILQIIVSLQGIKAAGMRTPATL